MKIKSPLGFSRDNIYLCERQWFGRSPARIANTLLHQRHCKLLMWDTMFGAAHVFHLLVRYVEMNPEKDIFEAFRGIIHETQLKSLLVEERLC